MANNTLPPDTARMTEAIGMYPVLPPMPKASRPGSDKAQHSIELVFEENSAAHKAAEAAIAYAISQKWPKGAPPNLKTPIKDPTAPSTTRADGGPARRGVAYEPGPSGARKLYMRAATGFDFPVWIGKDRRPATVDDIYSGGIWLIVAKVAPYAMPGAAPGVTAYLQLAWRTSPGTRMGSGGFDADSLDVSDVSFSDGGDDPFAN